MCVCVLWGWGCPHGTAADLWPPGRASERREVYPGAVCRLSPKPDHGGTLWSHPTTGRFTHCELWYCTVLASEKKVAIATLSNDTHYFSQYIYITYQIIINSWLIFALLLIMVNKKLLFAGEALLHIIHNLYLNVCVCVWNRGPSGRGVSGSGWTGPWPHGEPGPDLWCVCRAPCGAGPELQKDLQPSESCQSPGSHSSPKPCRTGTVSEQIRRQTSSAPLKGDTITAQLLIKLLSDWFYYRF